MLDIMQMPVTELDLGSLKHQLDTLLRWINCGPIIHPGEDVSGERERAEQIKAEIERRKGAKS